MPPIKIWTRLDFRNGNIHGRSRCEVPYVKLHRNIFGTFNSVIQPQIQFSINAFFSNCRDDVGCRYQIRLDNFPEGVRNKESGSANLDLSVFFTQSQKCHAFQDHRMNLHKLVVGYEGVALRPQSGVQL